jgi:hypothetical protein
VHLGAFSGVLAGQIRVANTKVRIFRKGTKTGIDHFLSLARQSGSKMRKQHLEEKYQRCSINYILNYIKSMSFNEKNGLMITE